MEYNLDSMKHPSLTNTTLNRVFALEPPRIFFFFNIGAQNFPQTSWVRISGKGCANSYLSKLLRWSWCAAPLRTISFDKHAASVSRARGFTLFSDDAIPDFACAAHFPTFIALSSPELFFTACMWCVDISCYHETKTVTSLHYIVSVIPHHCWRGKC